MIVRRHMQIMQRKRDQEYLVSHVTDLEKHSGMLEEKVMDLSLKLDITKKEGMTLISDLEEARRELASSQSALVVRLSYLKGSNQSKLSMPPVR